jgi:putative spermidine/putrescine transport system substrate-binding protein
VIGMPMNRRDFGRGACGVVATLLSETALAAASSLVAATFPGSWEDAYRNVIVPLLAAGGYRVTLAPALAQDQVAKIMATPGRPAYDLLSLAPGQTAVAIENNLIDTIDVSKIEYWDQLHESFKSPYGPAITIEVNGIAYNPGLVPRPSGYRDLFENPLYTGKVSWTGFESNTAVMAYTEIAKIYGKGADDMDAVFKLFRDHPIQMEGVVDSTAHQMEMFQQGDIAVFMCSTNNVAHLKSLGIPAEFAHPATGSPAAPVHLHMTRGSANAAAVYAFMNAAISKAAQDRLKMPPTDMFPTNDTVALTPSIASYMTRDGLTSLIYPDWVMINKHRAQWIRQFDSLVAE